VCNFSLKAVPHRAKMSKNRKFKKSGTFFYRLVEPVEKGKKT
jgi:hypothetical protein